MSGSPNNQFFRRIAPAEPERGLENGLGDGLAGDHQEHDGTCCQLVETPSHGRSFRFFRPVRKARSARRAGFVMVEAIMALSVLTVLGLVLLKLSINILSPRQWVLQQTVTDAYMTYERAYAERIPFEDLLAANSPWPASTITIGAVPAVVNVSKTDVTIGRLPGGAAITGTVTRTRFPDSGNYPIDGGTGSVLLNPAAMKVWKVQSVLTYRIGNRTYAKSRTVLRSQ